MKNLIERDKKRRRSFKQNEKKRFILKQFIYNRRESELIDRWPKSVKLSRLNRNTSKTQIRNRCIFSGRGRSILKQFRVSRHFFRKLGSQAYIPGLMKSSW